MENNNLSTIVVPEYLVSVNVSMDSNNSNKPCYEIKLDPSLIDIAQAMDVEMSSCTVTSVYEMGFLVHDYHEKITAIINRLNNFKNIKETVFKVHEVNDICNYGNVAQLNSIIDILINISHVSSFNSLDNLCRQLGKKLNFVDVMRESKEEGFEQYLDDLESNPMYKRETFAMLHLYLEEFATLETTFSKLNILALYTKEPIQPV